MCRVRWVPDQYTNCIVTAGSSWQLIGRLICLPCISINHSYSKVLLCELSSRSVISIVRIRFKVFRQILQSQIKIQSRVDQNNSFEPTIQLNTDISNAIPVVIMLELPCAKFDVAENHTPVKFTIDCLHITESVNLHRTTKRMLNAFL